MKDVLLNKKKMKKDIIFVTTVFILSILLISAPSVAIHFSENPGENIILDKKLDNVTSTGPAPYYVSHNTYSNGERNTMMKPQSSNYLTMGKGEKMYVCSYNHPLGQGSYYFDLEDPGNFFKIGTNSNIFNGGTWVINEGWIVADQYTGVLYEINHTGGEITEIGGGGIGLNALAYDPVTGVLYGGSGDGSTGGLWLIDIDSGEQEYIGDFVISTWMIGLACGMNGDLYGWDVNPDYFYSIDKETGEATAIGPLGVDLNYAQDGAFFYEENVLYLTAYFGSGGQLCTVDLYTGALEVVGALEDYCECYGSMFISPYMGPIHDVGIKKITKPEDGFATDSIIPKVLVNNYGSYDEITDVKFEIIKCETGPILLEETFDTWPPVGWSYHGYEQSYTNNAVGTPPEAYYGYYDGHHYSQGYLECPPVNASDYENINLKFRMLGDMSEIYSPFFFLQYRKNSTSPWRDVSPWKNPVQGDLGPLPYEVNCYGWGKNLGNEFQIRFYFDSLYYYLQYNSGIYIDDVIIEGGVCCSDYIEQVEDIEVPYSEEVEVEFPEWTPSEWHNLDYQDVWVEYPLSAYVLLEDNNTQNNKKQRLLSLYYPFLHDVSSVAIDGPVDGPAQTFPMDVTVKNLGQCDECCFKTYITVSEIDYDNSIQLLYQDFYPHSSFPPDDWTRTNTKWMGYSSNYCGAGDYAEARFYYSPSEDSVFRLYSGPIDTTGYGAVKIQWLNYLNHYSGPYTIKVETSPDGLTWTTVWEVVDPSNMPAEMIEVTTSENVGSDQFHISYTFDGYSNNVNWWHLDDVYVYGIPVSEPEFTDEICIGEIKPGEEILLEFDDWTPEFLAEETSGQKTYAIKSWTDMQDPEDNNHANDATQIGAVLDFTHDVEITQVDSPLFSDRQFFATDTSAMQFVWFDPDDASNFHNIGSWPNSNFPQGATFVGDELWVCDTNGNIFKKTDPLSADYESVGSTGTGECVALAYHEKSKVLYGGSAYDLYIIDMDDGSAIVVGSFDQLGYYMISLDCDNDGVMYGYDLNYESSRLYTVDLETGHATPIGLTGVSMMYGQDMAYDSEDEIMYATVYNLNGNSSEFHSINLETGQFTKVGDLYNNHHTTCFAIPPYCPCMDIYITPGTYNIEALATNVGTFSETNMSAFAKIYEYLTDCKNGTLVYEDNITGIDIPEPLGGTYALSFNDYNFADEGPYAIFFKLVDDNDDKLKNNKITWEVNVDDTAPASSHSLDPATPDGLEGYYVSDVEVTLSAYDPTIGCYVSGSGVKEIKYSVNGQQGTLPGESGTFEITTDGNDVEIEYWAIDNVGNTESHNSFTIDVDRTNPIISNVEWQAKNKGGKWYVTFTCYATDETSDMDRVEMYVNEGLVDIIEGPGPEYEFEIQWTPILKNCIFNFVHYNRAGLFTSDEVLGEIITAHNLLKSKKFVYQIKNNPEKLLLTY